MTYPTHSSLLAAKFKELKKEVESQNEYTLVKTIDGLKILRKKGACPPMYKAELEVELPAETIIRAICKDVLSWRQRWDEQCIYSQVLEDFGNECKVIYSVYRSPTVLLNHRDFVFLRATKSEGNTIQFVGTSIEHHKCPPTKEHVRGEISIIGYHCEKLSENKTKITYVCQVDFKGILPQWVQDYTRIKQAETIYHVRNAILAS